MTLNFGPENFEMLKRAVFIGELSMSYPAIWPIGLLEEQDYKTGYNGWLQVYQRLLSRYNTLTLLGSTHNEMQLDYDEQELWGEDDVCLQNLLD